MHLLRNILKKLTPISIFSNFLGSILLAYSATPETGVSLNGAVLAIGNSAPGSHLLLSFEPNYFYWGIGLIIFGFVIQFILSMAEMIWPLLK